LLGIKDNPISLAVIRVRPAHGEPAIRSRPGTVQEDVMTNRSVMGGWKSGREITAVTGQHCGTGRDISMDAANQHACFNH
jgi:hypothetical protein